MLIIRAKRCVIKGNRVPHVDVYELFSGIIETTEALRYGKGNKLYKILIIVNNG